MRAARAVDRRRAAVAALAALALSSGLAPPAAAQPVAAQPVAAQPAPAQPVLVGLFAPSAPFPSSSARVALAARLGEHLGRAVGSSGIGRAFARAADFAAAVRRGELAMALVDATYLATLPAGSYEVIAGVVAGRGRPDLAQSWHVVARGITTLAALRASRVLVPATGGREAQLLRNALLGGAPRTFAVVEAAPDTASALAALELGKADAAVVPAHAPPPVGAAVVAELPPLATPVLIAYGRLTAERRAQLTAAASSFAGDATIAALAPCGDEGVRAIRQRLAAPIRRAPLAAPPPRLVASEVVAALLAERRAQIERTPPQALIAAP